jgi:hypothetical protein
MVAVLTVLVLSSAVAQTGPTPGSRLLAPAPAPTAPAATAPALAAPAPAPAQPAPLTEHLQAVRPDDVRLSWSSRHWQLTQDGQVLKDFGPREQDARRALRLVQQLHLDQYGTVGSPPVMEYWLSSGAAPHSTTRLDLRPVAIDAGSLAVKKDQGRWVMRDKGRVLFEFASEADAAQALAVVRKYHFDQVGVVGYSAPMHVFLGKAGEAAMPTEHHEPTHFTRVAKNSDGTEKKLAPKTASPYAGIPQPGLPPVSRVTPPSVGPVQPTLTSKQSPLWREQPHVSGEPARQPTAERVPFDWRRVEARQEGADWKLVAGGQTLANFGPNVTDARLALSAVRYYRFTEEHRVGGERPLVNYCTASMMAPRGVMLGLNTQVLAPEALQVRQVGEGFVLCSNGAVVMKLGDRREEAARLLEVIKANRYDRLCQLGEPGKQGLALLLRSR